MYKSCFPFLLAMFLFSLSPAAASDENETESEKEKWDVNQPGYSVASKSVDLDLTRGTWMSLDVSPDGKTIVFDLLGNLYEIPIDGGDARPLTQGLAWDIQPRFSPDGQTLAFISDRAGGDNIWLMDRDSRDFRQLSFEDFRLLNNPTWSPDGEYVAARKHFTTSRSLGTGEIWLWHADGGEGARGVQVVEKVSPTFQKELGEPHFAPDGKSIYFTQNVTPGNMFIYHQDTNQEIFRIRQVDLETGEINDVVGGPGGAVRPTPSPDGQKLAFVKRVRGDTQLFVRDLATGEQRSLVAGLDPDMQETWGVHGLYPNMDWLPDSESIVYWASGQIWRVDVDSGERQTIAFRVRDSREVYPAPRPRVQVDADAFETQMVRFATRSPDGAAVVFESLGHLYIKEGSHDPRRLTRNDQGFEFFPAWSPDSRHVYYVHWQDQQLGSIRRVSLRGGVSRDVLSAPGHYVELDVSADGDHLLYRKMKGGSLRRPDHDVDPGIYLLDLEGDSAPVRLRDKGHDAHFVKDRIYFTYRARPTGRNADTSKTQLQVMNYAGHEVRDVAVSELGTVFRVSPDGRHVAFQENYHVHLAPLPSTGRELELGPEITSLPVRQVSDIVGSYPGWVGNTLSWSEGPALNSLEVTDALDPMAEVAPEKTDLSQRVATDRPSGMVALINVRIVTMNQSREVIENGIVIVDGHRIETVGSVDEVVVPDEAAVIDAAGKTLLPGLIDAHAHGAYGSNDIIPENNWDSLAHLALGVTTQHNPSSLSSLVFAAAEYQRSGRILSSRLYSTGEIVYGAKGIRWAPVESLDDALTHVQRLKSQGAISIKNYNQPNRYQRQMVIEAARQEGMHVVAEGGSLYHMDMNLIVDGSSGIEHNVPALNLYDDVISLWRESDAGYTPTLVVTYGGLTSEDYYYAKYDVWRHPILSHFVPPEVLQPRSVRRLKAPESDYRDDDAAATARLLMNEGVIVNIGAHGQREGLASHWEMWSFVRGGMTPVEAIAAATINPATYLGMNEELGSIEPGKLADLVLLSSNPLINIEHSDDISHVMLNGRLYEAATLDEVVTGDREGPVFWWHEESP